MQKHSKNTIWVLGSIIASIAIFTTVQLVADEISTNKKPAVKKWSAEADLAKLEGRWRISKGPARENSIKSDHPLVKMLRTGEGILIIEGNKFHLPESGVTGLVSNKMNKIEVVPKRWLNTDEPRVQFVSKDKSETALLSYVVTKDFLSFRYPQNSCSRSGQQFTLKRQNATETK